MIKVPVKVTYAVKTLLELASPQGSGPIQAKVIARRRSIPIRFIEQILSALKGAGIVDSLRGAQGGYTLIRDPSELSLADIVEAMNGSISSIPVASNGKSVYSLTTPPHQDLLLESVWEQVQAAERDVLRSVTLKDLVDQYRQRERERSLMYHI